MFKSPLSLLFVSTIMLGGCNAPLTTSVGDLVAPAGIPDPTNFATANAALDSMSTALDGSSATSSGDFPTSDTLDYLGYARINTASESVVGGFGAQIDFATDAIYTEMTNVVMDDDTALTGAISGSGTIARGTFPQVNHAFAGTLTGSGTTYDFSGTIAGAFIGATGENVALSISGNRTINGGSSVATETGSTAIAER